MVAGAADSAQHPQASSAPVPSSEEEALKRNTDCVYFLASPLTCKKGSECEYRHSDYARVNPRDCWYWLNGNCLNRKCAFRHPPLDGLLGGQAPASSGASLPLQQVVVPPSLHNSYNNSGRQPVPCIFFQKGFCMKGDKCAFLHGTNSIGNKATQATTTMLTGDLSSSKKHLPIIQNCSQEQKVPANSSKPTSLLVKTKPVLNAQKNNISGYETGPERHALPGNIDEEASRPSHPSPTMKESSQIRSRSFNQTLTFNERNFQNDKEAEEHLRESSPGFDVLVDDELGDSGYFHGEDHYGRMGAHDQRNLSSMTEYDMDRPSDYDSLYAVDREMLQDLHAYESYQMLGQFGWDQHQNSSEIISGGLSCREGRDHHVKIEKPDVFGGSDLRHRLSKQRRVNGLRSVVGNNFVPESLVAEPNHRESSQRDAHHAPFQESSLSGRLKGRIRFPDRSAADDRGMGMERSRGRLQRGRISDRLKGRLQDGNTSIDGGRHSSGPWNRRDTWNNDDPHFARPKSLSELKSTGKQFRSRESSLHDQQGDADQSFEGPKPLSVLLKRKRGGDTVVAASEGGQSVHVEQISKEMNNSQVIEGLKSSGIAQVTDNDPNILTDKGKDPPLGEEGGMVVEDAAEEDELYGDDQQDGFYDYEQDDDVEYNEDVDNAHEEYLDDEDGDDFAKKVGVILT
ncbi:hypothetical protein SAY87_010186 [Trapa incisa]|uniref:C3H1-type domain-containing protein n=1 Tax=Trapa incisa TaxID=236973 RepID=A0AAN7JHE9_9MYRT|nr:hypothetical protein SAY87_010186 [Trapa incisa]